MIKLVSVKWVGDSKLSLIFLDGSQGIYNFDKLLAENTTLTLPLQNVALFQCFFLKLGALCWPNGLEFSASKLHSELRTTGTLCNAKNTT
jgi:hypothetical protein